MMTKNKIHMGDKITVFPTYIPFSYRTFNYTIYNCLPESNILLFEMGNFACMCPLRQQKK
jgi:hypothetical protein